MADSQLARLARPFPSKMIHDNPSGFGSYVPHHLYVQRLLLYLGGYDFERVEILRGQVKGQDDLGEVVVGVMMRLTTEVDGRTIVIDEVGDCERPENWPHDGARLKDAVSDALKRCCARIGLGTHLYAKDAGEFVLYDLLVAQQGAQEAEDEGDPEPPTIPMFDPDDPSGAPFDDAA